MRWKAKTVPRAHLITRCAALPSRGSQGRRCRLRLRSPGGDYAVRFCPLPHGFRVGSRGGITALPPLASFFLGVGALRKRAGGTFLGRGAAAATPQGRQTRKRLQNPLQRTTGRYPGWDAVFVFQRYFALERHFSVQPCPRNRFRRNGGIYSFLSYTSAIIK